MQEIQKVVIIGGGPAGHTAAIYAARADLKPILYEGFMAGGIAAGGQLTTTTDVENYPGFPDGILGPELVENFRKQSARFGTVIHTETISRVDFSATPFRLWTEGNEEGSPLLSHTVIIATGATARRMQVPGEDHYWQKGISACAVCDGALPLFRGVPIAVIGGGDTAAEEAIYLTRFASKVYIVHRRDKLRASTIMQKRLFENPKIEILWNSILISAGGYQPEKLGFIETENTQTHARTRFDVGGLFYAIGHVPNTQPFRGQIELDEEGYIQTRAGSSASSVAGVFAAGDVQDKHYKQAITAAGSGCMAALDAQRFLEEQGI